MTIYFFLIILAVTLQNTVRFWAYTSCFKLKMKPPAAYAIYLTITAAVTFINFYYQLANNKMFPYAFIFVLLFYWLPFHLLTEGKAVKKFILSALDQLMIDTAIEFFIYILFSLLKWEELQPGIFDYKRLMGSLFFVLLSVPIKYAMVKLWNLVNKTKSGKIRPIFFIFPICQIFAYLLLHLERLYSREAWVFDSLIVTAVYVLIMTASSVIYIIFISAVEKANKLEKEYNALNYTRQLEEAHYAAIEEKQRETAKIRHDFKNQLIALQGLVSSCVSEEAKALFSEMENSVNASKEKEYCSVPVINAILSEKERSAKNAGVSFECNVSISDTGRIHKIHLCSIFSNLIDNAIKECSLMNNGNISISAGEKNGYISVRCENSVRDGRDRVLKPSESKGYGMKILQDIAEQYGGRYRCEIKDGRCVAAITVGIL